MGETRRQQLNRQVSLTTRLAATALLVGVAVIGCGHGNAGSTQTATPAAQSSQIDQAGPSVSPDASASASDSAVPSAAINPAATPDPLDSPLNSVNQLLNGINSSLQDSGSGGGE
jgi:hypothetical protein